MSSILNKFEFFRYVPQEFKLKIKLFHVFKENFAYFVTNEDQVYNFNNYDESGNKLIKELSDQNIEQFFGYSYLEQEII